MDFLVLFQGVITDKCGLYVERYLCDITLRNTKVTVNKKSFEIKHL